MDLGREGWVTGRYFERVKRRKLSDGFVSLSSIEGTTYRPTLFYRERKE